MTQRKRKRPVATIDELNDRLAGRLAREAELARIRAAQAAERTRAATPPVTTLGRARPRANAVRAARLPRDQ